MSGYGSYGSTPSSSFGQEEPKQRVSKEELDQHLTQQLAVSQMQAIIQGISKQCFKMCISKPSSQLTSSDQACINKCADRYLETFQQVQRAFLGSRQ
eukprot:m.5890 g.5890  ORF g.5890 m.5890 type:complete len:97 (+) comp2506_c0_seq1:164-454(+)